MASACTLLCPVFDLTAVLETVELNAEPHPVTVTGTRSGWDSLDVAFAQSRLRFTSLFEKKDAERDRRTRLAIFNFFMIVPTDDDELVEFLKSASLYAPLLVGVVGDPELTENEGQVDCVFAAAVAVNALIFSGSSMLAPNGALLLDGSGQSETQPDAALVERFQAISNWRK